MSVIYAVNVRVWMRACRTCRRVYVRLRSLRCSAEPRSLETASKLSPMPGYVTSADLADQPDGISRFVTRTQIFLFSRE